MRFFVKPWLKARGDLRPRSVVPTRTGEDHRLERENGGRTASAARLTAWRAAPIAALFAVAPGAAGAGGDGAERNRVPIREWTIDAGGRTRDPDVASPDAVWFVGQTGHYLARLTPSTGEVFIRPLEDRPGPHNLIVDRDGIVWYAGNLKGYIGRYDPATDRVTKIPMPRPEARDPHTLTFGAESDRIWFTVQQGNFVGRLDMRTREVRLARVPSAGARPYGIRIAPDGTPWVALLGTNRLAAVDPESLTIREVELPSQDARPRRLEIAPDGGIWYSDFLRGRLGLYDPTSGRFDDFALPGGPEAYPYGTALDAAGRVWVVTTGTSPNRLVGFDTASEQIVSVTEIPSGGGAVRHMTYFAPKAEIWFGTDAETIGRADVGRLRSGRPPR